MDLSKLEATLTDEDSTEIGALLDEMARTEGWRVLDRMLVLACHEFAHEALNDDDPVKRPPAYYRGKIDGINTIREKVATFRAVVRHARGERDKARIADSTLMRAVGVRS